MAEWRPSAAAGPASFGIPGSDGPQIAAVACAAEPASGAGSECTLEQENNTDSQF